MYNHVVLIPQLIALQKPLTSIMNLTLNLIIHKIMHYALSLPARSQVVDKTIDC